MLGGAAADGADRSALGDGADRSALADPESAAQWARLHAAAIVGARRVPRHEIERFCCFVGYGRSGHTLVGSLLNAHPEMVIAHELDAVRCLRHGFGRRQLFAAIVRRDLEFGALGRWWMGYDYRVPGQFQGRTTRLRVIGDKRGRATALQLGRQPALLRRLRRVVGVPLRVVHVTRDPFDNIASEVRRRGVSVAAAIEWYEEMCRAVLAVRPLLEPGELLDVQYEAFADDPAGSLDALCRFLGVTAPADYLDSCAAVVFPSTRTRRCDVTWSAAERRAVERIVDTYEALAGYRAGAQGGRRRPVG